MLLMQWKGPYKVVKKVGRCDYKLFFNGKIKPFHANLLKKYISRKNELGVESNNGHNWTDTHAQGLLEIACTGVIDSSIDRQDDGDVSESSVNEEELIELPEFQGKETVADVRINPELSATQLAEVSQLLEDFKDVLTDVPGEQT